MPFFSQANIIFDGFTGNGDLPFIEDSIGHYVGFEFLGAPVSVLDEKHQRMYGLLCSSHTVQGVCVQIVSSSFLDD